MHKTPIVSLIFTFLFSLFFTWALHVIFSGQTVDSHVVFLVTARHLFHQGGIFAQSTNDVGVEGGTVKVTGLVFFQERQRSLKGAHNKVFAVEAVAQLQISFVLGRPSIDEELEKSIFNGGHIFGMHSFFARHLDLALKVAGHGGRGASGGGDQDGRCRHHNAMRVKPFIAEMRVKNEVKIKMGKGIERERGIE